MIHAKIKLIAQTLVLLYQRKDGRKNMKTNNLIQYYGSRVAYRIAIRQSVRAVKHLLVQNSKLLNKVMNSNYVKTFAINRVVGGVVLAFVGSSLFLIPVLRKNRYARRLGEECQVEGIAILGCVVFDKASQPIISKVISTLQKKMPQQRQRYRISSGVVEVIEDEYVEK